ncbi:MAG TPA: flavin reductase family protein [Terriglobia bacterium]|nr:flavin reductase family protein [Terriglobia bacterium]
MHEVASAYGADDQTQDASAAVQRHVCNDIALRRSLRCCHRVLASQASFKPPLIMAAIRTNSTVFKCLSSSGFVAIHVLGADQQETAQRFFFPTQASDGCINGEPFTDGVNGVPILPNMPAHVECRVVRILADVGDHAVVLFEVVEAACRDVVRPLTIAESPWQYGG